MVVQQRGTTGYLVGHYSTLKGCQRSTIRGRVITGWAILVVTIGRQGVVRRLVFLKADISPALPGQYHAWLRCSGSSASLHCRLPSLVPSGRHQERCGNAEIEKSDDVQNSEVMRTLLSAPSAPLPRLCPYLPDGICKIEALPNNRGTEVPPTFQESGRDFSPFVISWMRAAGLGC